MEKDELKKAFHAFFNKINNILTAAGLSKIILQGKDLNSLSVEELRGIVAELSESLGMIEKNSVILNGSLRELYDSLLKELNSSASNPSCAKTK